MEKFWVKSYPPNVPAEIDASQYPSVLALITENIEKNRYKTALSCLGKTLTYDDLEKYSLQLAAWLQAQGVVEGTRVAVMMPNILQYPVTILALLRAGYVVVNVNPLYTPRELAHQLKDSGAEVIIVLENFADTLQKVIHDTAIKHVLVTRLGDLMGIKGIVIDFLMKCVKKKIPDWALPGYVPFKEALRIGAQLSFQPVEIAPDTLAFLQYTGGTTGVAKGVMLINSNIVANILQTKAWVSPLFNQWNQKKQMVFVIALPLYHIYALTVGIFLTLATGGLGVLVPNPRDLERTIDQLKHFKINVFPGVNTLFNALMHHPKFNQLDFSELLLTTGGGMATQESVGKMWFEKTGKPILDAYGLSETSPGVSGNPVTGTTFSGTIGLPLPSTEVRIIDDEENDMPLGESGEIAIRGPQVMVGYWNRLVETDAVMTRDGFLRSGDIGVMDERGYIRIIDRKKDMILVSGFNVYPNEVEDVASGCPGVFEVAVIGVPDAHTGEAVKLFVVPSDPALTKEMVHDYCKARLAGYKRPKHIEFREELPKSPVGKVLRRMLKA